MTQASAQQSPMDMTQSDADDQYLTFKLGAEMFAISIHNIREIMEYGVITTVPMMPGFVKGVINLRGSVVPVIDLQSRFGRGPSAIHRRSCIVILEVKSADATVSEMGLIVDEVSEVREILTTDIEPPPSFGASIRSEFISGMGKIESAFVILLDVAKVLDEGEMSRISGLTADIA